MYSLQIFTFYWSILDRLIFGTRRPHHQTLTSAHVFDTDNKIFKVGKKCYCLVENFVAATLDAQVIMIDCFKRLNVLLQGSVVQHSFDNVSVIRFHYAK